MIKVAEGELKTPFPKGNAVELFPWQLSLFRHSRQY